MPVERVKGVLDATDLRTRQALIAAHLKQMESQLERTAAAVTALRTLLEEPARVVPIGYRTAPATWSLAISAVVTLDELVAWWMDAFDELASTLAAAGIRPAGSRGTLYAQGMFEQESGEVVAFIPVEHAPPGEGRAEPVLIPASPLAVTIHYGDHEHVARTYGLLGRHIAEHALHVRTPVREYYLVGPDQTDDRRHWQTEIAWPIRGISTEQPAPH
jgi:effector-binding domain-containing protein